VIRVFLVDDHASFRQPLAFILDLESDIEVVGQAGSLAEARGRLSEVDVAVVDLDLPDGNGVVLISELQAANPDGGALVVSSSFDSLSRAAAVEAGASGLMHKSSGIAEIVQAVRDVATGKMLLSTRDIKEMLQAARERRARDADVARRAGLLTLRELDVIKGIAEGLSDREIAIRLGMSSDTARTHVRNILSKLGAKSRLQALIIAVRYGIVSLD